MNDVSNVGVVALPFSELQRIDGGSLLPLVLFTPLAPLVGAAVVVGGAYLIYEAVT